LGRTLADWKNEELAFFHCSRVGILRNFMCPPFGRRLAVLRLVFTALAVAGAPATNPYRCGIVSIRGPVLRVSGKISPAPAGNLLIRDSTGLVAWLLYNPVHLGKRRFL
jgi:hypothetical protein